jgi:hypothetical protein
MARTGEVSERLRAFVRERVRKDGKFYVRGNAVKLARALGQEGQSWVNEYTDMPPRGHASIDEALAICRFYGVSLEDFTDSVDPVISITAEDLAVLERLTGRPMLSRLLAAGASLPDELLAALVPAAEAIARALPGSGPHTVGRGRTPSAAARAKALPGTSHSLPHRRRG